MTTDREFDRIAMAWLADEAGGALRSRARRRRR